MADIIEEEGLVENAEKLGHHAIERLKILKEKHPSIGDVRGRGFLFGVELVTNKNKKKPANDLAEEVFYRCLNKGLSFKISMGNVLTFTPPLILTKTQMDFAIDTISECLGNAEINQGIIK